MSRGTRTPGASLWSKPASRRAILTGAVLAGAAGLADVLLRRNTSTGTPHAPTSSGSSSLATLYKIKYFPIVNAGFEMWMSYDGPEYEADMRLAKDLGFNSFHVFLAARPGVFDFPNPTQTELNKLIDLYNRSKTVGIKLGITLFDHWVAGNGQNPYGQIAGSRTWAKAVIGALPDLANLSGIEVKNEIKLTGASAYRPSSGFDSGWPSSSPRYGQVGQVATVWIRQMIPYVRSIAPGLPVTTSTTGDPTTDLAAFVAAVRNTEAAPDWYDWHCYTGNNPGLIYIRLRSAINVVGGAGPLYIGETGCSSQPTGNQTALQGQQTEADYVQAIRWYCAKLRLPEPTQWILFDMLPSKVQFTSGNRYGLYNTKGAIKLSGKMYRAIPPGSTVPPVPVNGTMQGGNQPDADGNGLPPRWYLYKGNNNDQPITSAIDRVNTYQGNPSVLLTGSANTPPAQDAPALMTNPITAPILVVGRTYTWAAYLKGSGSYGQPALEVSWFNENEVQLGSTKGEQLTLTNSFTRYALQATAPAGAVYAKVLVKTPGNAGSIWVANASWA